MYAALRWFLPALEGTVTTHRLRLFVAAARHLSVTKASQELRISQSSISHQLKLLQEQIGAILLIKTGHGIKLTDQGQVLFKEALSILSQIDRLSKKYQPTVLPKPSASLTLGGSYGPSALLPSVMAVYSRQNPSVELRLRTGSSMDIQDLVVKSEVEIAVATNPMLYSSLIMEPLREEKLSIFVSARHPLSRNGTLDPNEISKLPFIICAGKKGSTRIEEPIAGLCGQNCQSKVQMRCDSPESVKAAVRNGAGAGILYQDVLKEDVRRGVFKILKVKGLDFTGTSYIIYSKEKPLSSAAEAFLILLRSAGTTSSSKKIRSKDFQMHSTPTLHL